LLGAAGIWFFFWAVSDVFGTVAGANNYLDASTSLGIMSVAVAMLMVGGEFDLSSGAMTGATGMLVVLLAKDVGEFGGAGLPLSIAIPITLAFAVGIGWMNGTLVERTRLPSFIVTLGTFFALIGAKLGFAKLFTDKVIVEGLDNAPDFEFWNNIFGATWVRNDHVWDSFLGGRDVVYGVLLAVGVTIIVFGLMELSFIRREHPRTAGLPIMLIGLVGVAGGVFVLATTDGTAANWTWGTVAAVGFIVGTCGLALWRYQPRTEPAGGVSFPGKRGRRLVLGLILIGLALVVGTVLDATSESVVGFLLTVQGLRAILFGALAITGLVFLLLAGRRGAGVSPLSRFLAMALAAVAVAVLTFFIQSQATSRRFRAEVFGLLLGVAVLILAVALLRFLFVERRFADRASDQLGRLTSLIGLLLVTAGVGVRMLWTTSEELAAGGGVITWRISVFYFIALTAILSWVLLRTRFGSWTFAVGGNKGASRQVGVPAARTKTSLFILVSFSAFIVGMLIAFRLNSVQANVGDGNEFLYIIAAVVGGNLLTGGYGSVVGAALGALIIAMSTQGIPFAGWNSDWRFLFLGVILLLAVLVNNFVRRKADEAS
jgi:ribose/xylose/arabinose/galactoside ABC-type transport system permease subunit